MHFFRVYLFCKFKSEGYASTVRTQWPFEQPVFGFLSAEQHCSVLRTEVFPKQPLLTYITASIYMLL